MKQKIVDFDSDSSFIYPDPSSRHNMKIAFARLEDAGWLSTDKLPDTIEQIAGSIQKQWSTDIPIGFYDNMSHSMIGYCNFLFRRDHSQLKIGNVSTNYSYDNLLLARLSFGPESKQTLWDRSDFDGTKDRLHISVYGSRVICPTDKEYKAKKILLEENVYFSMRWIKDKFDDQSTGILDLNSRVHFDTLRSTYFYSTKADSSDVPFAFADNLPLTSSSNKLSPDYDEFVSTSKDSAVIDKKFGIWRNYGKYHQSHYTLPEVGYELVLGILSRYGDVKPEDFSQIKKMNHAEGAEYFLKKIVPAMKNFVESK